MNLAVEMMSKLQSPKPMLAERKGGRARITPDVILAAFACELQQYPVGRVIIESRYLADEAAKLTLADHVKAKVMQEDIKHVDAVADIVTRLVLHIPLRSQRVKLRSLHKSYGARARRSQKLIETWKARIRSMEKSSNAHLMPMIEQHKRDIENERAQLAAHAEIKAVQSLNCPKCGSSGAVLHTVCNECGGAGYIKPKRETIFAEFRQLGVRITEEDFARNYSPVVSKLVSYYCSEEIVAADALAKRLRSEKFAH